MINKDKLKIAIDTATRTLEENGVKLVDVFASYHLQTKDHTISGFGNIVSKFPIELYKNNMGKFIEDLQKTIELALKQIHNNEFEVKLLFWR